MLRTQLRLSPAACRAARLRPAVRIGARWQSTNSPETAAGTASDAGPPPFPRSTPAPSDQPRAHALYTVTPLPPMPPPLPADISSADTVLHSGGTSSLAPGVTIAHQAPAAAEQLAILGACLSSGDVARAEEVAKRIRTQWARAGNVGSLSTLLPPRVHTDFLKAYFVRAILPRSLRSPGATESLAKSFEGLNLPPSNTTSAEASADKSVAPLSTASRRSIHKAWTYFDSLFGSQWDAVDPLTQRTRRGHNGAIDASVIAVMLKGVTSLGFDVYNPTSLSDPDRIFRPITYLLPVLRQTGIDLLDVVRDPIFDIDLPSYLGKCSREQALDALEKTGKGREGWDEWQAVIDEVKREVERLREGREKEAKEREAVEELDPVVAPVRCAFVWFALHALTACDLQNTDVNVSLETLRTSLGTLSVPLSDSVMSRANRQRLLEESSYDAARQLYIHEMEELAKVGKDRERGLQRGWLQSIMFDWHRKLSTALYDASCATGKSSPWGKEPDIEPFLRLLPTDKMALITIVELMRLCGGGGVSDGMKAARAVLTVGRAVESEYHAEALKEAYTNKELQDEISRISESGAIGPDGRLQNRSQEESLGILWRRELAKREQAGDTAWRPTWTQTIRAKVGSILVSTLMDIAHVERTARHPQTGETLTEMQPAFSHAYQYVRGQKLGIIKVNPVVAERLDQDPLSMTLHPRYLPMLVQPKPWLSWNSGAYLLHQTQMMRTKDSDEQLQYLQQASDNDTLDTIFTGLDALGSVSWQINRRVFDVVSTVWNAGEAIADIPNKDSLVDPVKAPLPENVETDPRARDTYRHRIRQALQARREAHSKRCDLNYKLEIARAFLDEKFYFPHNLDFRGRAYPIPPNLSHIGDDMCRGLLMFGEAKPLGERGLRWLKIHAANLCGYDKASFDERERWTMEHLENIFDSADKPLDGQRWWLKADDPWQCLATCIELTDALRSEVPTDYACALPVHQDGTCNGLQHYAALGGDLKGAHQVNLDAGDRPADVYSGVASMVNEIIDRDAADGVAEAEILKGKVTRKVVKQTVSCAAPDTRRAVADDPSCTGHDDCLRRHLHWRQESDPAAVEGSRRRACRAPVRLLALFGPARSRLHRRFVQGRVGHSDLVEPLRSLDRQVDPTATDRSRLAAAETSQDDEARRVPHAQPYPEGADDERDLDHPAWASRRPTVPATEEEAGLDRSADRLHRRPLDSGRGRRSSTSDGVPA